MRALLRNVIKNECDKHVQRYFEYLQDLEEYTQRRTRREGSPFQKKIKSRRWWAVAPQFNPFKVRTAKRLNTYAKTISEAIRNKTYSPRPALIRYIPKADGRRRTLNIFQLPDAALSNLVYESLLAKNVVRFSAYAYAYRQDRTAHDAVNEIFNEFSKLDRVYVAEYDFSGFFDEIEHSYHIVLVLPFKEQNLTVWFLPSRLIPVVHTEAIYGEIAMRFNQKTLTFRRRHFKYYVAECRLRTWVEMNFWLLYSKPGVVGSGHYFN